MSARKRSSGTKTTEGPKGERLQKILASAGVDSRRNCEELILNGEVTVNGRVIDSLPAFADAEKDDIRVNGRRLSKPNKVYYLLNKPKGVICTSHDPEGRPKAVDLIDSEDRIYCVGRLDADTVGAILLTNDSELVNRLTHPKYELAKIYQVRLRGRMETEDIEKLKKGIWMVEGKTGKASIKVLKKLREETILEIETRQGLNRQIRLSFARLGYKVREIKRMQIGNISIKGIQAGAYKVLTKSQVEYLYRVTKFTAEK